MSRDEAGRGREADAPERDAAEDEAPPWDADDARRQKDCFAPPKDPCECWCMHCRRVFTSDQIWFQRVVNDPQGFNGFWMCPTPNCSGAGFTFDIFPTDPDHPANAGWTYCDDEEEDPEGDDADWDPDEPQYQALDEEFGDEDDDLEGEEWKYGLQPGERPPEPEWSAEAGSESDEDDEEERYDQPDERPRVLDWSDRQDRQQFKDDDIPF